LTPVPALLNALETLLVRSTKYAWASVNLVIPRCRLSIYGTRAFDVAGPVC